MYAVEVATASCFFAEPSDDFILDIMFMELICTVFCQARYCGLCRIPVVTTIHIEIGRPVRQTTDGVAESGYSLTRLDAT